MRLQDKLPAPNRNNGTEMKLYSIPAYTQRRKYVYTLFRGVYRGSREGLLEG